MEEGIKEVVEIKIPEFTRGEKLVGITFNPSANPEVDTVKRASAFLIDTLEKHRESAREHGTLTSDREFLIDHAIGEVINAQMNVVKAITFQAQ